MIKLTNKQNNNDKELRQFNTPNIELRAEEGKPTTISGYAVEWDKLSDPIYGCFREKFKKGAFTKALIGCDIRALWQHNVGQPLGRTTNNTLTLTEDDTGLRYEIKPPSTTWGTDAVESIRRGDVTNSSFLFSAKGGKEEWDDSDPAMSIRTVTEATLFEVSPVTFPAYPQSSVGVRSAQEVFDSHAAELKAAENIKTKSISQRRKLLDFQSKI